MFAAQRLPLYSFQKAPEQSRSACKSSGGQGGKGLETRPVDSSGFDSHSGVSRGCHSIRLNPGSHARWSSGRLATSSPLCQPKEGESRPRGVLNAVS